MVFRGLLIISAIALLANACSDIEGEDVEAKSAPDIIVIDADVRTVDPANSIASAFAVKDGKFLAVGNDDEIQHLATRKTQIIKANGATIIPGLIDGHSHLFIGLRVILNVDLYGDSDKDSWLRKIEAKANSLPEGEWVLGGRWDHSLIGGAFPNKQELDEVAPNNPVFLQDVDGHSAWANSRAMELGGITFDTVAPDGGEIVRDPQTGQPTGILLETAKTLITNTDEYAAGVQLSDEERQDALAEVVSFANSVGLTGAHEMASVEAFSDFESVARERPPQLAYLVWFPWPFWCRD